MLLIAIDGACHRNGKPNCVSTGGVFITELNSEGHCVDSHTLSVVEDKSTNQRGELLGLLSALTYIVVHKENASIITDSEYIFNAMFKEWYKTWRNNGWVTAEDEPVKNSDLWEQVGALCNKIEKKGIEVNFYHVKGHCIPFGKVTATHLLEYDESGAELYNHVLDKYDTVYEKKKSNLDKAKRLSVKNNGFEFDDDTLRRFVALNTVADLVASVYLDAADR